MITIEEFKKKQLNTSRLIGLDLGSKRIGVAICDENQKIATPLKTINKSKFEDLINELEDIIKENNIKGIIIGNPSRSPRSCRTHRCASGTGSLAVAPSTRGTTPPPPRPPRPCRT